MKIRQIKYINSILILSLLILLPACFVSKKYTNQTGEFVKPDLFRKEFSKSDTNTIANIHWTSFFTDPILQAHIQKALSGNFDLQTALANVMTSEAYYQQAKQQFYPSVFLSAEGTHSSISRNSITGKRFTTNVHYFQYGLPLNLSWEIDVWGRINSAKKAAKAGLLNSVAGVQTIQSNIVAGMANIYYQLVFLDEKYKVIQQQINARKSYLETAKELKKSGTLTEVAVNQSEALVLNAEAQLIEIETEIKILENAFSMLQGVPMQKVERSTLDKINLPKELFYGVPLQLLSNRPDVRAAEFQLIQAFELENSARAGFYPTLSISSNSGLQSMDIDKIFSLKSIFMNTVASLSQPLWNKRYVRTQYEIALAKKQVAYLQYRKSILTAANEVSDALLTYEKQQKIMSIKEKEYQLYKTANESSLSLLNFGMANYLEVLNAQVNQLNAQMAYLNAYSGGIMATIKLYKAVGGGWKEKGN